MKTFLFDIGGVILDDPNYEYIYNNLKCSCTLDEFVSLYRDSKEIYYDVEKGVRSTFDFFNTLKKKTGLEASFEEYLKVHNASKGTVSDEFKELLIKLKNRGYKIGILSNLKKIDVEGYKKLVDTNIFDYEFYSCYLNYMKPEKEIFTHVAKVTDVENNDVYFFDNREDNVMAAKECGIKAILSFKSNLIEIVNKLIED